MTTFLEIAETAQVHAGGLITRNVYIHTRRTSLRLEIEMWDALQEVADRNNKTIHELCSIISANRPANSSTTSAIRVYLISYYREGLHNSLTCREEGAFRKIG